MFSKKMFCIHIIVIFIAFLVFLIGVIGNIQNIGEFDGQLSVSLHKSIYNFEIIEFSPRSLYYMDIRNISVILLIVIALPINIGFLLPTGSGFSLPNNTNRKIYLKLAMIASLLLIIVTVSPVIIVYVISSDIDGSYFLINFLYYSELFGIITQLETISDCYLAVHNYNEWYNNSRIHQSLNYMTPQQYENKLSYFMI